VGRPPLSISSTIGTARSRPSDPLPRGWGIQEVRTAPRSPWQNAYAERVIGSIRRECTDQVVVMTEGGLRRILVQYLEYYHHSRTHLALNKDAPVPRTPRSTRLTRSCLLVPLESQLNPIGGSLPSQLANAARRKFKGSYLVPRTELLVGTTPR